ncbi:MULTISPECIES: helix-turn-helix transcriptional regulator [Sphingomonas]|uniref:helix-turn-helix transcriptional regulator n=1 Tax=Sphingomonas TaxID=13687 RepID=UPI001269F028|nr:MULTISPECIES: AraC family transcriptional regulator [Sphingomonas]
MGQAAELSAERVMEAITVSPEMLSLVGRGSVGGRPWPPAAVAFVIEHGGERQPATVQFVRRPRAATLDRGQAQERLILLVDPAACDRLLGHRLDLTDGAVWAMPADLRSIALAIRDCRHSPGASEPFRLAKSIELLCELLAAFQAERLTDWSGTGELSPSDARRLAEARVLIDQEWQAKLTLDQIARRCGLNRTKLARGFRQLYDCSVSEALAERRLAEARKQLIATDLPVGLIGYRSGYLNNASFTRAFGRRFGVSPSDYRACGIAA